jgi:diguanylate cyclase (GGDEF)-like protein
VSTCEAALEAIQDEHYDVVLLDLALPDTDGTETIIRISQTRAGYPLIVLSASDNVDLAVDLLRLGVQDYLVKERINADRLHRSIRYAIQRKHNERRLEFLAGSDQLTGLMNRDRLRTATEQALANADRRDGRAGLLFVDLDHFKAVNDEMGHATGDELLIAVARRLNNSIRRGDIAARLGGDEFAILLECVRDAAAAETVAHKIVASLSRPFSIEGREHRITASIGITIYPDDGRDARTLLRNADMAMYRSKARGGNSCHFYTEEIAAMALHRHERLAMPDRVSGAESANRMT